MKRILGLSLWVSIACLILPFKADAQRYDMNFVLPKHATDSLFYIGYHYRDQLVPLDSATMGKNNTVTFKGTHAWKTGIYALFTPEAKKEILDFPIEGNPRFRITLGPNDEVLTDKIEGSTDIKLMYQYLDKMDWGRKKAKEIDGRKKSTDPKEKEAAEKEMESLSEEMTAFEKEWLKKNQDKIFFRLAAMMRSPEVPDDVEEKAWYYRTHYWDLVELNDHSLVRTPDLFNKMNYYFFGVLYHADSDTIIHYTDMLLKKIEGDTLMMRYVMDWIMPRYYRSTKNIGWDAVWCYLVKEYYLKGKCPWATKGELYNKQKDMERLSQSLIGAKGQELWMADTNQSNNPADWISSHRFPQKYVILWFWDPDCHHCQEQTATLKTLYDSLAATGNKPFEVYAIGYEADVAKWKKYVREHKLPFVNVGGPNVNIDYQVAYNVHGAPTMIILNEKREIIMNKVLPTSSILPFLKRYEEKQKE